MVVNYRKNPDTKNGGRAMRMVKRRQMPKITWRETDGACQVGEADALKMLLKV